MVIPWGAFAENYAARLRRIKDLFEMRGLAFFTLRRMRFSHCFRVNLSKSLLPCLAQISGKLLRRYSQDWASCVVKNCADINKLSLSTPWDEMGTWCRTRKCTYANSWLSSIRRIPLHPTRNLTEINGLLRPHIRVAMGESIRTPWFCDRIKGWFGRPAPSAPVGI